MSSRRGRLWYISRGIPAHGLGGMERVVHEMATGLARRGWSVSLITTRLDDAPAQAGKTPGAASEGRSQPFHEGVPEGVELHALDAKPGRFTHAFSRALLRWGEAHRKDPPDLILTATLAAGPLVAHLAHLPAVFQAHGSSWAEAAVKLRAADGRGFYRLWLYLASERAFLRRFERIIAVGPAVRSYFERGPYRFLDRSRIVTIPNGIDLQALDRAGFSRQAEREALGVKEHQRLVLTAGLLIREKGALDLLRAYAAMEERRRIALAIAGEGRDAHLLSDLARREGLDQVRLLGRVPRDRLLGLVRASDLVAQVGTRPEGLPLIVLEALCLGCPVLVSDAMPLPAFGGEEGVWRARAGDPRSIGEGLRRVLESGAPMADVAASARARFSLDRSLDEYEALFAEVIAAGCSGGAAHDWPQRAGRKEAP